MLDIRLFRNRAFAAVNVTALLFSFGMFGSIFFLSQFLQTVQGLLAAERRPPGAAVDGDGHAAGPAGRPGGRAVGASPWW